MRVIYQGVDLFFIETYAFNWESVYDDTGTDYLYDRVEIVGRAVVNGQEAVVKQSQGSGHNPAGPFISYKFGDRDETLTTAPVDSGNSPRPGVFPSRKIVGSTGIENAPKSKLRTILRVPNDTLMTHQTIRHRLTTPQGKLFVFTGMGQETNRPTPGTDEKPSSGPGGPGTPAVVTLESPADGFRVDCKNGPFPKILGVHTALGADQTLLVDWACETFINEAELNDVRPTAAMISNRFSQTHDVDADGYTTVTTEGTAIFRTDFVYAFPESPDLSRPFQFMPISQGFVRQNISVQGLPDVTGVRYAYQDRQVHVNFPAGPYVKAATISTNHRQAIISNTNVADTALSAYERYKRLRADEEFSKDLGLRDKNVKDADRANRRVMRSIAKSLKKLSSP